MKYFIEIQERKDYGAYAMILREENGFTITSEVGCRAKEDTMTKTVIDGYGALRKHLRSIYRGSVELPAKNKLIWTRENGVFYAYYDASGEKGIAVSRADWLAGYKPSLPKRP